MAAVSQDLRQAHTKEGTMERRTFSIGLLASGLSTAFASRSARAAAAPSVIRIGYPSVGIGNRPIVGGTPPSTVHLRGLLEEEFKAEGVKIQWNFLRGAGPAVNELFANGLADFGFGLGDLPSIIGHAGGLKTRVLAAGGIRQNTYLAVPSDSSVTSIKELRGKKVAFQKGTNLQLAIAKILDANGITEKDIRALNMDNSTAKTALITKDVDAMFGQNDLLALRDQGTAKIIFTTRDSDPRFLRHSSLVASQEFIDKYPDITHRVVKNLVLAGKWISDQEAAPAPVYQLWSKSGTPFSNYKEDYQGSSLKLKASPLIDDYFSAQYRKAITDSLRFGLIKNEFSFDSWVEPRFLKQVLKEQNLESYWRQYDNTGKPKS
jgi:sulfonate transport system substrate-binding protein